MTFLATLFNTCSTCLWRRKWQPTPVFLLGKSHGQRSLEGYSPWGCKSDLRDETNHLFNLKTSLDMPASWPLWLPLVASGRTPGCLDSRLTAMDMFPFTTHFLFSLFCCLHLSRVCWVWALCYATRLLVVTVGPQTSGNRGGETSQV